MLELIQLVAGSGLFIQNLGNAIIDVQASISSYSLKHSVDAEMSIKVIGNKRFKGFGQLHVQSNAPNCVMSPVHL